jgi:hypothetical protein
MARTFDGDAGAVLLRDFEIRTRSGGVLRIAVLLPHDELPP